MKKKKIIIGIITAIILLGIIFGITDYNRIKSGRMPIFMIRITSASESKLNYIGLGYRMQRKVGVSYKQEIYMDDYVKFGTWVYISEIEIPENRQLFLENINNTINAYFSSNNNSYPNRSANYIDYSNKVVVVELVDNSKEQQEWFKENIVNSKYIKFIQGGPNTVSGNE